MGYIGTCRSCGSDGLKTFFDLGEQPLANALSKNKNGKDKKYPLVLVWCPKCHLVQLNYTVDPEILFKHYVWTTSSSETAIDYSTEFCKRILEKITNKQRKILDIGSNDGTFLLPFKSLGFDVLGVDPASNITEIAGAKDIPTIDSFFSMELARDIVKARGKYDIVMARNVIPHVSDVRDVIQGMKHCMSPKGLMVIEFHYAKKIMDELHYDSIYHEHLCYFTVETIEHLLNQYGLYIHDIKESPISGGSLVVYCRPYPDGILARTFNNASKGYISKEGNDIIDWITFKEQSLEHMHQFKEIVDQAKRTYGPVYGYGSSARSSTLLNVSGVKIRMIGDVNPLKQGLYTAGSHIPIVSPKELIEEKPNCICVLAWNLSKEIIPKLRKQFNYEGPIIVPLPGAPHYDISRK